MRMVGPEGLEPDDDGWDSLPGYLSRINLRWIILHV
jgi:hypothetical protein